MQVIYLSPLHAFTVVFFRHRLGEQPHLGRPGEEAARNIDGYMGEPQLAQEPVDRGGLALFLDTGAVYLHYVAHGCLLDFARVEAEEVHVVLHLYYLVFCHLQSYQAVRLGPLLYIFYYVD